MTKVVVSNEQGSREIVVDNGTGGYDLEFINFHEAITGAAAFKSDLRGARNDLFAALAAYEAPGVWQQIEEI